MASQTEVPEGVMFETSPIAQKAILELWQVEARWRSLGMPATTELMAELKDNPPLPGTWPLGTKGLMANEVARQQGNGCGKLRPYLPKETRDAAAKARLARMSNWAKLRSRRTMILGASAFAGGLFASEIESEEAMDKRDTLEEMPLMIGIAKETIKRMGPLMDMVEIDTAGHELIKAGTVPTHFFILVDGDVEVLLKNGTSVAKLSGQSKEDPASSNPFFGEIGMLTSAAATATVKTLSVCTLLGVSGRNFPAFLALVPDLTQRIAAIGDLRAKMTSVVQHHADVQVTLEEDLREANEHIEELRKAIDEKETNISGMQKNHGAPVLDEAQFAGLEPAEKVEAMEKASPMVTRMKEMQKEKKMQNEKKALEGELQQMLDVQKSLQEKLAKAEAETQERVGKTAKCNWMMSRSRLQIKFVELKGKVEGPAAVSIADVAKAAAAAAAVATAADRQPDAKPSTAVSAVAAEFSTTVAFDADVADAIAAFDAIAPDVDAAVAVAVTALPVAGTLAASAIDAAAATIIASPAAATVATKGGLVGLLRHSRRDLHHHAQLHAGLRPRPGGPGDRASGQQG